jgi:tetratricopeptide (TPR) repeat protein
LLWRDFDKAEFHIERALALNPNDDKIVCQIGELATYSGRPEEGESWVRRAIRLNPLHQLPRYWLRLAQALYHQRRFAEVPRDAGIARQFVCLTSLPIEPPLSQARPP